MEFSKPKRKLYQHNPFNIQTSYFHCKNCPLGPYLLNQIKEKCHELMKDLKNFDKRNKKLLIKHFCETLLFKKKLEKEVCLNCSI